VHRDSGLRPQRDHEPLTCTATPFGSRSVSASLSDRDPVGSLPEGARANDDRRLFYATTCVVVVSCSFAAASLASKILA
jgi:hypothetical protein